MIRKLLLLAAGFSVLAGTAAAQTNIGVGVTVDINQPGVYGRVTIGNVPPPVVYPQPVIITPRPIVVQQQPIYMKVPPGHAKKWSKHCHKYSACNQPVYFVQTAEYSGKGKGKGNKRDD
ncbi:MAG: hypothetical protein ACRCV9_10930 [Burkholderiaceae bacterium]